MSRNINSKHQIITTTQLHLHNSSALSETQTSHIPYAFYKQSTQLKEQTTQLKEPSSDMSRSGCFQFIL